MDKKLLRIIIGSRPDNSMIKWGYAYRQSQDRRKLSAIISHFCADVPAVKAALLTGLNRKTINLWYGKFRQTAYLYQQEEFKKIIGEAEVDESYFGARRKRGFRGQLKRGRGTQKQPVFGIFKRKRHVYTEIVPNCKKVILQAVIRKRVSLESVIYSDKWRGYDGLVDVGYDKHLRVNHGENEFSKGEGIHINGIENFWSFTKRRLAKFNGVKKNFEMHLKESEWRYSKNYATLKRELRRIINK